MDLGHNGASPTGLRYLSMKGEKGQKQKKKRTAKKLLARVTHLEMNSPHSRYIAVPTRPVIALMRAQYIPAEYYRSLYELVGKAHHWQNRRTTPDAELYAMINDENCEIHILYADGCPAGFFELDLTSEPQSVEIVYFGLGTDYQGLGLGKWFLSAAISAAWARKPEKVVVTTNSLDHPAALPLYQKLGFSPVRVSEEEITPWK